MAALWTTMPETSVDENSDFFSWKNKIRMTFNVLGVQVPTLDLISYSIILNRCSVDRFPFERILDMIFDRTLGETLSAIYLAILIRLCS